MTPKEVMELYARQYPSLSNGEIAGPFHDGDQQNWKLEGKQGYACQVSTELKDEELEQWLVLSTNTQNRLPGTGARDTPVLCPAAPFLRVPTIYPDVIRVNIDVTKHPRFASYNFSKEPEQDDELTKIAQDAHMERRSHSLT